MQLPFPRLDHSIKFCQSLCQLRLRAATWRFLPVIQHSWLEKRCIFSWKIHDLPSSKLTWLAGKSPSSIGNTSSNGGFSIAYVRLPECISSHECKACICFFPIHHGAWHSNSCLAMVSRHANTSLEGVVDMFWGSKKSSVFGCLWNESLSKNNVFSCFSFSVIHQPIASMGLVFPSIYHKIQPNSWIGNIPFVPWILWDYG